MLGQDYKWQSNFEMAPWCLVGENKRHEKLCSTIRKGNHFRQLYKNDSSYQSVKSNGVVIGTYDGGGYYFLFSQESERVGEVGLFLE